MKLPESFVIDISASLQIYFIYSDCFLRITFHKRLHKTVGATFSRNLEGAIYEYESRESDEYSVNEYHEDIKKAFIENLFQLNSGR